MIYCMLGLFFSLTVDGVLMTPNREKIIQKNIRELLDDLQYYHILGCCSSMTAWFEGCWSDRKEFHEVPLIRLQSCSRQGEVSQCSGPGQWCWQAVVVWQGQPHNKPSHLEAAVVEGSLFHERGARRDRRLKLLRPLLLCQFPKPGKELPGVR